MKIPTVLCLSGLDPSGGAGLQADIETLGALHCYALPITTCLTVQNTQGVTQITPVKAALVAQQIQTLLSDICPNYIKVGLLGSTEIFEPLLALLEQQPALPLVVDPILKAGGNQQNLASEMIQQKLMLELLPRALLFLPNASEAQTLSGQQNIDACADVFAQAGSRYLLITDTQPLQDKIVHALFHQGTQIQQYEFERLPHQYHGSGCTLSSSACAFLCKGQNMETALANALHFTWQSLLHGHKIGAGQWLPNRFFAQYPSFS